MLEMVILGSLCVMGLYAAMGEGMILEWFRELLEKATANQILKPIRMALYECPICMASVWGTVVWLTAANHVPSLQIDFSIAAWSLYVFAVAGFNYVVLNMMDE